MQVSFSDSQLYFPIPDQIVPGQFSIMAPKIHLLKIKTMQIKNKKKIIQNY